jgi:hypothetical protein
MSAIVAVPSSSPRQVTVTTSYPARPHPAPSLRRESPSPEADAWRAKVLLASLAGPADCCPARPAAVAVLPELPGATSDPGHLMLCEQHTRQTQAALRAAGAMIYHARRRF